jgi:Leucine-rich repeat (LRR) protein
VVCQNVGMSSRQVVVNLGFYTQLYGYIPESISAFRNLTSIIFFKSDVSGIIPRSINTLENLEVLHIEYSPHLVGPLPDLAQLKKLTKLVFASTGVHSSLPSSWASLPNLKDLRLEKNQLSGEVPKSWNYWPSLESLDMSSNQLNGSVPGFFGCPHLFKLNLSENAFSNLPEMIGPELVDIDLSFNMLQGSIPQWSMQPRGGPDPRYWLVLKLRSNRLSGAIPDMFGSFHLWDIIDLSHNNLTGTIPHSLTTADLIIHTALLLNDNDLSLCPPPKSFDTPNIYGVQCDLNNQLHPPKCACIEVFLPTMCYTTRCV